MSEEKYAQFSGRLAAQPQDWQNFSFTAGLVILFPDLFAGRKVVGKNHTALLDTPADRAILT